MGGHVSLDRRTKWRAGSVILAGMERAVTAAADAIIRALRKLRHPSPTMAAVLSLLLAAAIVGVVLIAASIANAVPWDRLDYGNVPGWLSAIAGAGTIVGLFLAWQSLKTNVEHRRDDLASAARLLVVAERRVSYTRAYPTILVILRNTGQGAFTDVQVTGVVHGGMGCQQTVADRRHEFRHDSHRFVAPNATAQSGWVLPEKDYTDRPADGPDVRYEYTDGTGKRWQRLNLHEPRRIYPPRTDPDKLGQFDAALAARPGGGIRGAPIDVELTFGGSVVEVDDDELGV